MTTLHEDAIIKEKERESMKMDKVAGSKDDEFYTPLYAVKPIFKYLNKGTTIWCPFDTADSYFVRYGKKMGFKVIHSHISEGKDFFEVTPKKDKIDYIISNPPYSKRTEVLKRLFELDIPFAMLLGVVGIFESQDRFEMFRDNDFEVMYMNKRISFFKDFNDPKPALNPPFSTAYFCHHILPNQICFEEIDKKDYKMEE